MCITVIAKKHALNVVDRGSKGEWSDCLLWILRDRVRHLWIKSGDEGHIKRNREYEGI